MHHWLEAGAEMPVQKQILFLGDDITHDGTYISLINAWLHLQAPQADIRLTNLGLNSETVSSLSEPTSPFPRPCLFGRLESLLAAVSERPETRPDWVVCCYGMNDAIYHPPANVRFEAYQSGICRLAKRIHAFGARLVLVTPPPFDTDSYNPTRLALADAPIFACDSTCRDYDGVLAAYSEWLLSEGTQLADRVVDIRSPLLAQREACRQTDPSWHSGDGILPHADRHWIIARTLIQALFHVPVERPLRCVVAPDESDAWLCLRDADLRLSAAWREHVGHSLPIKADVTPLADALARATAEAPGIVEQFAREADTAHDELSFWRGHLRHDFYLEGFECILVEPDTAAATTTTGVPWVWRTEFFDAFAQADLALLEEGWHLAYICISDRYGCTSAVRHMDAFHRHVTRHFGLSTRPALFGFSRGGLYAVQFAAAHPDKVSCLYLDAPVLDICSWPGGKGSGIGSPKEWQECLAIWGLEDSPESLAGFCENPLDRAKTLAAAKIPVLLVAGDADDTVPWQENGEKLKTAMDVLDGNITVILKPGVGHHPHSLTDPAPITAFVKNCVPVPSGMPSSR